MSRIYTQQKRPAAKAAEPSYSAAAFHAPSLVSGEIHSDLDALMQAKYRQHFLDNQIPTAEAEADRIAASVSGARTPEEVKTRLGEKMGADFSHVTFHTDSSALKQADTMGARAYTTGSDVYFGSGGFDPGVAAHELVHTVQQGVVGSTMQTVSAPTGGVQMDPKDEQRRMLQNLPLLNHFQKDASEEELLRELLKIRMYKASRKQSTGYDIDEKYQRINHLYQNLLPMTNTKAFAEHMAGFFSSQSQKYMDATQGQDPESLKGNQEVHAFSAANGLVSDIMMTNTMNSDNRAILEPSMDTPAFNSAYSHYISNFDKTGVFNMKYVSPDSRDAFLRYELPSLGGEPAQAADTPAAPQPTVQPADRKAVTEQKDREDRAEAKSIMSEITKDKSIDLGDMNGKSMLKNARGLRYLSEKFKGLHLRKIKKSSSLGDNTVMAAGVFDRNITINPKFYTSKKDAADPSKLVMENKSSDRNYTLAHEAGHILNYQIADRLNEGRKHRSRLYGSGFHSSNHNAVARILLAEAMLNQANSDNAHREKLQELLLRHTGVERMEDFNVQDDDGIFTNRRKLADALKNNKKGSLLDNLNKKGFTSRYGATHAAEMYAEAFGQHVYNETKRNGRHRKQHNTRGASNLLSDEIVRLSQDVFDDNQGARSRLYTQYGNDKKTSFWTALRNRLFGED